MSYLITDACYERKEYMSKAKAFVRTYGFLASILPFTNASWEKLSIFLNFLIPKLPAPVEEDRSKGILENIDMESLSPRGPLDPQYHAQRSGCRNRAGSHQRRGTDSGAGTGALEQHRQGVQRSLREHRLEGRRQNPQSHRRGNSGEGGGG